MLDMPLERLQMAKYKLDLFQWITIANEQVNSKAVQRELLSYLSNYIHVYFGVCGSADLYIVS